MLGVSVVVVLDIERVREDLNYFHNVLSGKFRSVVTFLGYSIFLFGTRFNSFGRNSVKL